ncbi:MAG: heavy-metal-associated domain-containing protein [Clostridiales bacterium]
MKKVYKMEDLGCAHCAAKMEDAISKLEGVESASVNFVTQKLTINAAENLIDSILEQARKIVSKIEPDCVILS